MMNNDEINTELKTVGLEPLTDMPHPEAPKTSQMKVYAVAAGIALGSIIGGILGYDIGRSTTESINSKQSVAQAPQTKGVDGTWFVTPYEPSLDKLVSFEGKNVADALEKTVQYGDALTMPELIKERCAANKNNFIWDWHDAHTEEIVGIDQKGFCVPKGEGVVVVVHGGGLLTPARIRQGYSERLHNGAVKCTEKEFSDLLESRLPTGELISMYNVAELDGVMERRYGVVIPLSVVKATKNGFHAKDEFVANPLVIARAGGTKYLHTYFDKAQYAGKLGNWHDLHTGFDASQPRARVVFVGDGYDYGSYGYDFDNFARFVGVKQR